MKLKINYSAPLRRTLGVSSDEIEAAEGCSLREVLAQLAGRREELRRFLYDPQGALKPSVLVCMGDEQVQADGPAVLKDGGEISLLLPISGG